MKPLICLIFALASTARAAGPACISDFRVRQVSVPNRLGSEQLGFLERMAREGHVTNAWAYLSGWGDDYARVAYGVIAEPTSPEARLYHDLIRDHWFNVVGRDAYRAYFQPVARQHFLQYLSLLHSGYWPDSDQVINSYLAAARKFGLPDVAVFDAGWDTSGIGDLASWEDVVGFAPDRTVRESRVCNATSSVRSFLVTVHALFDSMF